VLSGENNVDASKKAKLIVTAQGNYTGTITSTFTIEPKSISEAVVSEIVVKEKTDTAEAGDTAGTEAGAADATVAETGSADTTVAETDAADTTVAETDSADMTVAETDTADAAVAEAGATDAATDSEQETEVLEGTINEQLYTGKEIKPNLQVSLEDVVLTEGTDYTVTFEENIMPGTATVTITGKGNYTGEISREFDIIGRRIADAEVRNIVDVIYNGEKQTQDLVVVYGDEELVAGQDYVVTYEDNTLPGTATVKIEGLGMYAGSVNCSFEIAPKDLSDAEIVTVASAVYTGEELTPDVTVTLGEVTLRKGSDYTVAYSDNVEVGTAKVEISGTGVYTGTASATFTITAPAAGSDNENGEGGNSTGANGGESTGANGGNSTGANGSNSTVNNGGNSTGANGSNSTVNNGSNNAGANSSSDDEDDDNASAAKVKAPGKVTISSAKNNKGKKLALKWKKVKGASGYEVTIATKKNFKSGKQTSNVKGTSKTFKKLKKNKTYYVRIRAYVNSNGKKVYGSYSKVKKVKITK
jgi:hypothetical protein